jgi:hypothetical protein
MSATPADPHLSSDEGLLKLTDPMDPQLDVVFVHGLDGSRCKTWTNANGKTWPSWLGEMVPTARIWTYGYDSGLWKKPNDDNFDAYSKKLLRSCIDEGIGTNDRVKVVFVGHSLGGILIKLVCTSEY